MGWRHLLFANWPVAPETLAPHLPPDLDPDLHDGDAWLSVVPYTNVAVRPRGLPAAAGVRLPELNLRTYVTHGDDAGVYFLSLDADGVLSVALARLLHGLPYYNADAALDASGDAVAFESRRRHPGARAAQFAAAYGRDGPEIDHEPGDVAHFLTERYRLFTETTDGSIHEVPVDHPRWSLYPAHVELASNTLFGANGLDAPAGDPLCYYSPGVDVVAKRGRTVVGAP
ncbi:MAG: YqjF family protein [Halobacteriaceae archaeon]